MSGYGYYPPSPWGDDGSGYAQQAGYEAGRAADTAQSAAVRASRDLGLLIDLLVEKGVLGPDEYWQYAQGRLVGEEQQ